MTVLPAAMGNFRGKYRVRVPGRSGIEPPRQAVLPDVEMFAEPNLLGFGGEPFELRVVDHVIERQEPPEIDGRIGDPAVPNVGNPQFPIDALVGDPTGPRAVLGGDDWNLLVHGKFQVHEALNKAPGPAVMHVEIIGVLNAGEHTAMETDHRNPLGVFPAPPERFKVFFTLSQMSNHGVSVMRALSVSRYVT